MPTSHLTMNNAGDIVPGPHVDLPSSMEGLKNWLYVHGEPPIPPEAMKEHTWEDAGGLHLMTIQCPDCGSPLTPASRRSPGLIEDCPSAGPVRKTKCPGRNEPCPCGSGKKFKKCHGG